MKVPSKHERKFSLFWKGIFPLDSQPVEEHKLIDGRRFRFDFAWLKERVALEIDGGIWMGGGHSTGRGKSRDCEKDFEASKLGWLVIRWTPEMITTQNVEDLKRIIARRAPCPS